MRSSGIRFLTHNIPQILPVNFNSILAFRIQNTLDRKIHFQSHGSFYGTPIKEELFRISVLLNGVFLPNVLVYNDCLQPLESATLYFPFQTSNEEEHRLQIIIAGQHTEGGSDKKDILFEKSLHVDRDYRGPNLRQRVRNRLFRLLFTEVPMQLKRLQLRYHRARLSHHDGDSASKKEAFKQCKELNRELAFMEKQVRESQVASLPCYLAIDTTSRCNLKCKMCFRNHVDVDYNAKPDMSGDFLDQLIEELFPTAITLNPSIIGEPLISSHIDKILKACADYQVYLSITTDGTLIRGDDFIKKLVSVLHYIEISFDSADPNLFEKLRTGAKYEVVMQNARKLGAIRQSLPEPKFNLAFSMTLFRENLREIPNVLRLIREVGGNLLKTDIGVIFAKSELHQSVLSCPDEYNEMYEIAHEKALQLGIKLMMRPPFSEQFQAEARRYGICDYLYLSACVSSDGELNPCYFHPIPSLSVKKGFGEAWNSKSMQRLRLEHDTNTGPRVCKDCYVVLEGRDSLENRRKQFLKGEAL